MCYACAKCFSCIITFNFSPYEIGALHIPILHMKVIRFKEVKNLPNATELVSGRTRFPNRFLLIPKIMIIYSLFHSFYLENV